jgi:hypothetical protein
MAANTQDVLAFPSWAPDQHGIGPETSGVMLNVVPQKDGFGPFKSFEAFTAALPSECRGFFFARKSDGSILVFAGTRTELYTLDNTTFTWVNASKGGGPYSPVVNEDNWQFIQFNDLVIAVQVNTVPQKFILASSTDFEDLGGSPPQCAYIAVVGFFVVLTGLLSDPRRAQWSDLGAPEVWTAGVGLSDYQDMSDGGNCINLSGGDAFGVLFQQESIRSITYAPGSAVVFQINRISTQETLFAANSIINVGDKTFYCGAAGFKMIVGSGAPQPIGKERVDRTFFADVDTSNLQLMIGGSDPQSTRVYWAYKSAQGAEAAFDKVLLFDYILNEWTILSVMGQWLGSLARPGITLEGLDAIALGSITVSGAADNGAGLIRLTVSSLSTPYFDIVGQPFIVVQGIDPDYMNGTWRVTVVDPTHIDIVADQTGGAPPAFGAAYVSGGRIGGSLETIPFSLDSVTKASIAALAAFDTSNQLGFFTGPNLEAILETGDANPKGRTIEVNGLWPMTDCAEAMTSIAMKMSPVGADTYSTEYPMDDQGWAEAYVETRYARGRLRNPAGSTWTYAKGIAPDVSLAGES